MVLLTIFVGKIVNTRFGTAIWKVHINMFNSAYQMIALVFVVIVERCDYKCGWSSTLLCFMAMLFLSAPLIPIILDIVQPLNESRSRVFAVLIKVRLLDQDKYYVPIFCYHIGVVGLGVISMVSIDSMYVAFIVHACSLLTIINRQLEEMTPRLNDERDHLAKFDVPNERALYKRYIECLKKHQLALEFINTFNSAYQMISLVLLLLNGATISVVGVRIVYILDQTKDTVRYSFIIVTMLIQLLIVCYCGQKLMDESQEVVHRAYAAEWYRFSPRLKSLLIITVHRGIVPCGLTAGKMIPLSMTTYAAVSAKGRDRPLDNGKFDMFVLIQAFAFASHRSLSQPLSSRIGDIMLAHVLREYNINRILLSRLGLWPFQSKLARSLLPIFCLLLEMSYYPFEILMFYDHRDDAQMIFESCYQLVITTAFLVRLWNEIWNRDKFQHLYEAMNAHWDVFTDDSEIRILKEYSTVSRKFTIFYATMMYILMSMFVVIPLIPVFLDIVLPLNESRPRILAIDVEFRVDTSEYFTPIFCYTTAIIVVGVSIMVGVDTMHFTCTTHACGLFFIVGEKIENILKAADESKCCGCCRQRNVNATELGLSNERAIYDRYVDCLRKYQHALDHRDIPRFVNILNSTHQTVAVFFLLLIGATLSLIGVRVSIISIDELTEYYRLVYAAEWYTFSPRLKSLMIVTLYRSVVPCSLTAGKMLPLSMTTYAGILTLYEHRSSGKIVFESCYQMVITFAFLIKLLNQLWNRDKFRRMYEIMEHHWNTLTSDLETRVLRDYSDISQKFTKYYASEYA
ncbi:Odorant receptor 22b [Harpegnathos saltator]|uniref:Odorant receptor 22b n=1 Tax=Harpegnathos saltator TaxID=610380 RepID=E2BWZ6_HARSA|nr:Odorant receptor 22b [Harpegnathos saltator]